MPNIGPTGEFKDSLTGSGAQTADEPKAVERA